MPAITCSVDGLVTSKTHCYGFLVEEGCFMPLCDDLERYFKADIKNIAKDSGFSGKIKTVREVSIVSDGKVIRLFFAGVGSKSKETNAIELEQYRRALGILYKKINENNIKSFVFDLPEHTIFGASLQQLVEQAVIAFQMTGYCFNEFITDVERKSACIEDILIHSSSEDKSEDMQRGLYSGTIIAQAVNKARHWIDTPPSHMTPADLAGKAAAIASTYTNLEMTVFNEKQVEQMGMGGLSGVSRGSDQECRLIILEYRADDRHNAQTVALVGKGITFDSGGLSIKPAQSMETMKDDMSGAAAVIATMEALANFKPKVNVVALMPMSENLINGKALKPGDIVRFYNGKTAEVKNTDAEGRLILADALSYGVKHYKPNAIIDIATLTGACAYALGPFYTGLMSGDEKLVERIMNASERSGDKVWRLPLSNDYRAAIRCDIADICNIGKSNYRAGAITAAHFLEHFVDKVPWAHLDIAGTAFDVPDISYYHSGATGVGVRLFIDLIMNWN